MRECESGSDSERIYGYICYIKEGIPRFLRPRADLLRMRFSPFEEPENCHLLPG